MLGLVCTALAFVIFSNLIVEIGPGRALVITYINPVVAVALGVTVLGERPGASAIAGLLLILAGSWLSTDGRLPPGLTERMQRRRQARAAAAEQVVRSHNAGALVLSQSTSLRHVGRPVASVRSPREAPSTEGGGTIVQFIVRRVAPLLVACALLLAFAASAFAADKYVALGDSYSSGTGTRSYTLNSGCQRGIYAYPYLLSQQRPNTALTFVACSGAKTTDVMNNQISSVTSDTKIVTITIGGNDAGFSSVITSARCR